MFVKVHLEVGARSPGLSVMLCRSLGGTALVDFAFVLFLCVCVYVCVHECVCVLVTVCTFVQASVLLLGHFSVLKLTCPRQEMWHNLSLSALAVCTGRLNNFVTRLFIYHHVRAIILFQATY